MKTLLGALLATLLGTGCGGTGSPVDLLFSLDLLVATNNPDTFSIAGVSTSYSGTRSYSWQCSTKQANITVGSTLTHGSIRLEVFDANGVSVHDNTYEATLIGAVNTVTKSGAGIQEGTWTLTFTFDHALFSGALTVKADTSGLADVIDIGGVGGLNVSWIYRPGWDANPVHVDIGGVTGGTVQVRLWDGNGTPVFDQTASGVSDITMDATGVAGVWTVQIDFTHAVSAGGVSLSQ